MEQVTVTDVEELLNEQAPDLAGYPVRPCSVMGSSNWVFRLGEHLAVRLPRTEQHVPDLMKELRWLPVLGRQLTLPIPHVEFVGKPSERYPYPWSVVTWVPGAPFPTRGTAGESLRAETLGQFLQELHRIDPSGQPCGAEHWGYRAGDPVTDTIDEWVEKVSRSLADLFDPQQVRMAWRRLREVPPPTMEPCWVHTDLSAENIVVGPSGELSGVIDFGGVGVGDRSVDFLYAWSLFDEPARRVLRESAHVDDETWLRARAWAFVGPGLVTIDDYRDSMPERTRRLVEMVSAVAADVGVRLR